MTVKHLPALLAAAALSASATAQDLNIDPGLWETSSTISIRSQQFSMPPQSHTQQECITPERIREGFAFLEENEDCDVTDRDVRSDGMSYTMVCPNPGGTMTMNFDMAFNGDSMSGTISGQFESQMGVMEMNGDVAGTRIGACADAG